MKAALTGFALWIMFWGVWDHDWRLIVAGASVALIWPLVSAPIGEVGE